MFYILCFAWISIGTMSSIIKINKIESLLISSFPDSIPIFSVRTYGRSGDNSSIVEVTRDRFQILGGFPGSKNRSHSLEDFKNILQCTEFEPSLDDHYGSVSIMTLYPLTREGLEGMLACVEKRFGSNTDHLDTLMTDMLEYCWCKLNLIRRENIQKNSACTITIYLTHFAYFA